METNCWEWLVVFQFQRGFPQLSATWYHNSPTFKFATNFAVCGLLVFLSSLLFNFLVRMIFSSDSPNGQIKDPTGRKRGCALSAGAPPPRDKSAGAAAGVVGVVGPTVVVGCPQTGNRNVVPAGVVLT